jgi:short subunit fatty acids transporter
MKLSLCAMSLQLSRYQGDLYDMYCKKTSNFIVDPFWALKSLFECKIKTSKCNGYLILILEFNIWPLK